MIFFILIALIDETARAFSGRSLLQDEWLDFVIVLKFLGKSIKYWLLYFFFKKIIE